MWHIHILYKYSFPFNHLSLTVSPRAPPGGDRGRTRSHRGAILTSGFGAPPGGHMGHVNLAELTSPQAWASLKKLTNLPAMQEIQIRSLGSEDPLEEEMATHSSILPWTIPWTRSLTICSPCCCRVGHFWATNARTLQAYMQKGRGLLCEGRVLQ